MDDAVGAEVASGAGASTGYIYCGSMVDVREGKNEAGSWFFPDSYRWTILINIYSSSARDQCTEDELHEK